MKKLFLTLAMLVAFTISAQAATVGYVDYVKVIEGYPLAQKYKKELESKATSVKTYLDQKEAEVRKTSDPAAQKKIRDVALAEIDKKQKDYATTKVAREKEIDTKIRQAAEKVRIQKKLEVMVKYDAVVTGGTDCTQDVLNLL